MKRIESGGQKHGQHDARDLTCGYHFVFQPFAVQIPLSGTVNHPHIELRMVHVMRRLKISEVFDLQMGKTPSRNKPEYWNNGEYDWVSIRDLGSFGKYVGKTAETISSLGVAESGIKTVPAHTLIMSFKLSLGKTAITTQPTYTNEAIMAFIDKGTYPINLDYFYHQFSGRDWSAGTNKAVMGATLNKRTLADMVITVPDGEEQAEVAAVLDGVELAIGLQRQRLDAFDQLVKSRFVEMFGDPEDPSSECEVCKLGDRCDVVTGNTPARARKEYYGPGIEWIKSDNVLPGAMHLERAKEQLTDAGKAVARIAKPGWLLMVCIAGSPNTIGNTAFVDREVAFNQQINGIDPRDENPIYLQAVLGLLKPRLTSGLNAALKCILNKSTLSATEVPFPSRGLQDEFAAFVAQVDKSEFAVQQAIEQLETLKASLMQKYFG